jgi:hypothetical protein
VKERWVVRWFRKRALLYHLLVAILAPGCLYAGWWQVQRAESGNTLSYLYVVEWPIFAIMSVVGWWQLIHEDPAAVESRKVERARRAANRGPFVPPPPDADSGFTHPLQPGSYGALGAARHGGDEDHALALRRSGSSDAAGYGAGDDQPMVHALSSYNAYLARLSAGGGRKSWRNPHGVTAETVADEPPPTVPTVERLDEVAPAAPPGAPLAAEARVWALPEKTPHGEKP